jgi:uncharacterized damage-inducible protein DinB
MKELDTAFDQLISTYSRSEFEERLENVDETQARARPIEGRHTIWEIVNHCTYWMEAAIGAVNGEEMPPRGGDWPPMGESEKTWREDQARLGRVLDGLVESVTGLDRGRLHEMVPGEHYPYSLFQMFFRVAYHNIYHAGQIAILIKRTHRIGS